MKWEVGGLPSRETPHAPAFGRAPREPLIAPLALNPRLRALNDGALTWLAKFKICGFNQFRCLACGLGSIQQVDQNRFDPGVQNYKGTEQRFERMGKSKRQKSSLVRNTCG